VRTRGRKNRSWPGSADDIIFPQKEDSKPVTSCGRKSNTAISFKLNQTLGTDDKVLVISKEMK
jgi:hypothetical protein